MYKFIPAVAAAALMITSPVVAGEMQKDNKTIQGTGSPTSNHSKAPVQKAPIQKGADVSTPAAQLAPGMTAENLKGANVYDQKGDKVASVKEIVQKPDGKANHAVLTVGSVLGIGGKDVRVPLEAIHVGKEGQLEVAMTEEELEKLPTDVPKKY